MPIGEVVEYADLVSVMEARERMNVLIDTAAASGTLKKHAHRRHLRDLTRQARGRRSLRRAESEAGTLPSHPFDETVAEFATVGIEVVLHDPEGRPGGVDA